MDWFANILQFAVWQKSFYCIPRKTLQACFIMIMCGVLMSGCTFDFRLDTSIALIETYEFRKLQIIPQKRIVLVGGCFDVLHFGHIEFLKAAKAEGDYLVVALEPDDRILKYKRRKPAHTQKERAHILSVIRFVDKVVLLPVLNGFEEYLKLVKDINPNVIAITGDDPQFENKQRQAEVINGTLKIVISRLEGFSSSAIKVCKPEY